MNFAKRILLVAGSAALAVMLGGLLAPKAVHAVVAALVQVTNTSANPVPVTDVGTLEPFQTFCVGSDGVGVVTDQCTFTVPANKRLVVRTASVQLIADAGVRVLRSGLSVDMGGTASLFLVPAPFTGTGNLGTFDYSQGTQQLTVYADPGTTVACDANLNSPPSSFNFFSCSVSGYLQDVH